jgi:ssRNA-specific RNase YbeY (16S rRNA maturation enzyme)
MAKLIITRDTGVVEHYEITPAIEVAFEAYAKKGINKAFREDEKQTDVYWLCWEAIRRSGQTIPPFGDTFLATLKSVEVADSDPLGG